MKKFKDIAELVNETEKVYDKCFCTLMNLKKGSINIDDFLSFQPELADSLYEAMSYYQGLCQKEKDLVSKKHTISDDEFISQIHIVGNEKKAIKKLIRIGKALGDGFAWFFYRNSRGELDKHFAHNSTGLMSGGLGGIGEIEFIKRNQNIDGLFVVYHGITSMLRIGDFSLCSIDGNIIGVGELKTKQVDNRLCISAYVSARADIKFSEVYNSGEEVNPDPARLERQLKVQDDLLRIKKPNYSTDRYSSRYNIGIIDEAVTSGKNYAVSNDKSTMVLTSLIDSSLYDLLFDNAKPSEELPDGFEEASKSLIINNSEYNEIRIMKITTEMGGFRQPVIWWRLSEEQIKNFVFGKLQIHSVFNIAYLYEELTQRGFILTKISQEDEQPKYKITKNTKNGVTELVMGNLLVDVIMHDLMMCSEIVDIVNNCIDEAGKSNIAPNTKIEMHLHQRFF